MRRYALHRPPLAHLEAGARWLRALDGLGSPEVAGLDARAYLARLALPAVWRTRDKLTQPELPPTTDLQTWAALGASDALAARQPRVNPTDQRPYALVYAAAYVAVFGAYVMTEGPQSKPPLTELGDPRALTWSSDIGEIAAAMAKAQSAMGGLSASHTAEIKSQKGDYEYSYANLPDALAACLGAFNANGCAILQPVTADRSGASISTIIIHESGQWVRAAPLLMPVSGNAQAVGSAITYGRRYQLLGMVGLAPDDDDGKGADDSPPERCSPEITKEIEDLCGLLGHARNTQGRLVFAAAWLGVALAPDPEARPDNITPGEAGLLVAWLRATKAKLARLANNAAAPRQPGEDDPADVEPPADWAGHDGNADDFAEGAGDR